MVLMADNTSTFVGSSKSYFGCIIHVKMINIFTEFMIIFKFDPVKYLLNNWSSVLKLKFVAN